MTLTEKREYAAKLMLSRSGKNSYTQGSKRRYFFGYPDNRAGDASQRGYSDCSSAVRAAIRAAAGVDIGGNTSAQIDNRKSKGVIVDETDGYYPDVSRLLPGDCLYFKGNTTHPLDVGHVEMYVGNGKCCGHGSGTGPKLRRLKDYCKSRANSKKRYFMAIRWINEAEPAADAEEQKPAAGKSAVIAEGSWNLRAGPDAGFASVGVVHGGDVLERAETQGWIPLRRGGRLCWISAKGVEG